MKNIVDCVPDLSFIFTTTDGDKIECRITYCGDQVFSCNFYINNYYKSIETFFALSFDTLKCSVVNYLNNQILW